MLALAAWTPFLADFILNGDRSGHIQSLILGAVLMLAAVQMFALGIIGDALAGQRVVAQRIYERVRRLELEAGRGALALRAEPDRGDDRDHHPLVSGASGTPGVGEIAHVNPEEAGGNVYDKYSSSNPIERYLVNGFLRQFGTMVELSGASRRPRGRLRRGRAVEADGARGPPRRGSDAFQDVIAEARARAAAEGLEIEFEAKPVQALDPARDSAELVVCCEVLEHLEDPEAALATLASLARPWLIASVPREPLWRALNMARGKYLGQRGNTPGHLNHWSKAAFTRFLETRFEVEMLRSPTPWTMALCRAKGSGVKRDPLGLGGDPGAAGRGRDRLPGRSPGR